MILIILSIIDAKDRGDFTVKKNRQQKQKRWYREHRRRKSPGEIPGTAIHTGDRILSDVSITVHDYNEQNYKRLSIDSIETARPFLESTSRTWIQVQGLHDPVVLEAIWNYFSFHPLIREDIVNTVQRPKIEHYPNQLFFVLRSLTCRELDGSIRQVASEQVSIILGDNFVVSFQESDDPIFDPVFRRLEQKTSRLRKLGSDYLVYALADIITDHYFQTLDMLNETIDEVEEHILELPKPEHLQQIHALRRDLIYFRKSVWSLRDATNALIRDGSPLLKSDINLYLRDLYDHIVQIIDMVESSREVVFGMFDVYMSNLSNRMNEVMKVLTIIATIFIPLTFVVGIYGMNFDPEVSPWNMPELGWYYGYPLSLFLMLMMVFGMVLFFRRRDWI